MRALIAFTIVALVAVSAALASGWTGDNYVGTDGPDSATGNANANSMQMLGGNDLAHGAPGDDQIRGGRGNDTSHGQGGYDTIWACGQADDCGGFPGEDWMYSEDGGGQLNAGQFPAKKQHIICANDFEVVYFDSADVFEGTKSKCNEKHNVSSAAVAAGVG